MRVESHVSIKCLSAVGSVCLRRYMRDDLMEYARTAVIPLQHGVGRYVRIQLEFDAKWMLISEVQFQSGMWRR